MIRAPWNYLRSVARVSNLVLQRATIIALLVLALVSTVNAASWESTLTASSPGSFPEPRPMSTKYRFGWSGFPAAGGDIRLTKPSADRFQVDAKLSTTGLVRSLWKFDANYTSTADVRTLHPVDVKQTENIRAKKIVTNLAFEPTGVISKRTETPSKGDAQKTRHFDFPNLFDLQSALLYLRSQPLQDHNVQRVVVYPATSAYLATVTVLGRERLTGPAGTFNAIKLDLRLNKIGNNRQLQPHRKFRRGTVWLSDDSDRLLLRIEAQVFVGTVFAELQSVEFDNPKPRLRTD